MKIIPNYYSEYKNLSLPWIDTLPSHWKMVRGKNIFYCIDSRSKTGNEELLTVSSADGVVKRKNANVTMFKAESYIGYKLCWPDDLVINSLWAWARGLGVSKYHGIISSAYGVYRIKDTTKANPLFIHEFVRSAVFQWELQVRSKGIWTSRLQLTDESFLDAPFLLPPIEEQNAIVRFLDYYDRLIKRYIRAKQKQIKLLNEQKQAIIHQAITRGLDPNVKLKPSGMEWLGDIPYHWEILPGKATFQEKRIPNIGLIEKKVLSLSYGKIIVKSEEKLRGLVPNSFETYQIIDDGDIIVRPTDLQNDQISLRFGLCNERGIITSAYLCLNTKNSLSSEFAYYLLYSYDLIKIIYSLGSGLRQNLSWDDFKYLPILVPPILEQTSIVDYINLKNHYSEKQIQDYQHETTKLKEYQTRLIADVVTGKQDVRVAATRLPAMMEIEEIEDIEETLLEDVALEEDEVTAEEGEA